MARKQSFTTSSHQSLRACAVQPYAHFTSCSATIFCHKPSMPMQLSLTKCWQYRNLTFSSNHSRMHLVFNSKFSVVSLLRSALRFSIDHRFRVCTITLNVYLLSTSAALSFSIVPPLCCLRASTTPSMVWLYAAPGKGPLICTAGGGRHVRRSTFKNDTQAGF